MESYTEERSTEWKYEPYNGMCLQCNDILLTELSFSELLSSHSKLIV